MKFLFDLFPVILFFGTLKWGENQPDAANSLASQYLSGLVSGGAVTASLAPVLLATAIACAATFVQIGYLLARRKKVDAMLWMSLVIITFFGGATIYFQNPTFIKWKPTVLYWLFALVLLGGQLFFKKNLIRIMMGKEISLPDSFWNQLNLAWAAFFSLLGVLNLYVAFNFSLSTWASFKLFGFTGLIFAFAMVQALFMAKYIENPK
jgi:intracellular septation protein